MSDIFYVYEHWRPDLDLPFYVGKGMGRRANQMNGRNRRHRIIQRALRDQGMCVEVRLVAEGLSEERAFGRECARISFWLGQGVKLANLTAGGEGSSNPSEETRALMRAAKVGRKLTEEHKAKIGAASRISNADPAVRKKLSDANKAASLRPETWAKRSAAKKGRPHSEAHKAAISAAHMGKKMSPEHAEKLRLANVGRKQSREEVEHRRAANTGKKRTPEFSEKMKALWTPERRSAQSSVTALRSADMNEQKAILRRYFPDKG